MTEPNDHTAHRPTAPASGAPQIRFNFTCKMCTSVLEAFSSQSGTAGRCPTCGAVFSIPHVDARTGLSMGVGDPGLDAQDPTPVHAYAAAGERAPHLVRRGGGEYGIVCPRCGVTSDVQANHCPKCGYPFTMEGASRAAEVRSDAYSVSALLMGLVFLPVCLCSAEVGGVGAFIAATLGWISLNRSATPTNTRRGKGLAITGLALGLCGLIIVVVKQLI